MELHWFLPLSPDVSHVGTWPEEGPEPSLDHLTAIVEAAAEAGCRCLLVPASYVTWLETFTAAAAVLGRTSHVQLMLAVRPNQFHPAQAAKMVASLQLLFPGRVRLNVTTGGWDEDRWIGSYDNRGQRYRRLHEWLEIVHGIWYGDHPFDFDGEIYRLDGARLVRRPEGHVPIAMSGSSPEAREALIRFGDSYLLFAAPPAQVADEIGVLRGTAGCHEGISVGLRSHIIVRETESAAWEAAEEVISRVDPRVREVVAAQQMAGPSQRAAQQRLSTAEDLVVSPNLWAGIGTGRFGVATAIVGDPQQVADRLMEYAKLGVDFFILSGYPKLAEARRFGQLVTPVLRERGVIGGQRTGSPNVVSPRENH